MQMGREPNGNPAFVEDARKHDGRMTSRDVALLWKGVVPREVTLNPRIGC